MERGGKRQKEGGKGGVEIMRFLGYAHKKRGNQRSTDKKQ